ncbi:MAG: SUMF1/EgtB/PvdO family nonheme iron enzyme [Chitinivibrionales bacterium]|nr:SUMF1/EgtB/PvdO family nonheme iron enzyme [Chitinivibrionales bacterium]MBD3356775.1 SUMF1/EgtB/PvdO family nonheme iron enzyme [Chitinivibrionales bacterium]
MVFRWLVNDPDGDTPYSELLVGLSSSALDPVALPTIDDTMAFAGSAGRDYYWQIRVWDNHDTTESGVRTFTVNTPPTCALTSPNPGEMHRSAPITLRWSGADDEPADLSELRYDLYIDTAQEPTHKVLSSSTATRYDFDPELVGRTYYWRVVVSDGKETYATPVSDFDVGEAAKIVEGPVDDTMCVNGTCPFVSTTWWRYATFSVKTQGEPNSLQWFRNGNAITGATGHTLTVTEDEHGDRYRCIVSNGLGDPDTSEEAALSVVYCVYFYDGDGPHNNGCCNGHFVLHGTTREFRINPDDRQVIASITHNGKRLAPEYAITVGPVTAPDSIEVRFAEVPARMKTIPARDQTFQIGDPDPQPDEETGNNERNVHDVTFTYNYFMDSCEVTQKDYKTVMGGVEPWVGEWNYVGIGDNYPANKVTIGDMMLYCNARSKAEGFDTVYTYTGVNGTPGAGCELEGLSIDYTRIGIRLPTEAEWEFAARAGTTTDYYWGKDYTADYPSSAADTAEMNMYAVFHVGDLSTQPVCTKIPNDYGLYDMLGNIFEQCNDYLALYTSSPKIDPTGPKNNMYNAYVIRGGGNGARPWLIKSCHRNGWDGNDIVNAGSGFRCVISQKALQK